ncbi:CCT motif family protein isoform 2 [Tripterygium wilfordii]|uniref:CCT motif family protein isoform 2 n=1 Tax=Tripterygium wilfordii TaxID=458696 RepID=A0A7J7DDP4_TRIWF|nr:zinc finger protein CONSTANS-LIKE 16 [Tripterygium wilfordii]KAF5744477.1 CCT motif family protein isoform 2 [Tripterygium wilfordii]
MRCHSSSLVLRSPKKEEQEVPDTKEAIAEGEVDIIDELEGILGIEDDDEELGTVYGHDYHLSWDFMDLESYIYREEEEDEGGDGHIKVDNTIGSIDEEKSFYYGRGVKEESETVGFFDEEEHKASLNLNLNYQEVLDAWSDRGPFCGDDGYLSRANNGYYMGEVPVIEEERSTRREASVMRYKEKRQTRLFSKKIRYQVRKLNADKRPRFKGRFVKRV